VIDILVVIVAVVLWLLGMLLGYPVRLHLPR
jgi:hypothetical protein